MEFMLDENIATPYFLPLKEEEARMTSVVTEAAILNSEVPLSEYIKREQFFKSFQAFHNAIKAEPALIKTEIQTRLLQFDQLYGIQKTAAERKVDHRFTQGDFRRFCSIFDAMSKRILTNTEFLMQRENKKRMMPRHLLTAAAIEGTIPMDMIKKTITDE